MKLLIQSVCGEKEIVTSRQKFGIYNYSVDFNGDTFYVNKKDLPLIFTGKNINIVNPSKFNLQAMILILLPYLFFCLSLSILFCNFYMKNYKEHAIYFKKTLFPAVIVSIVISFLFMTFLSNISFSIFISLFLNFISYILYKNEQIHYLDINNYETVSFTVLKIME